jgi:hypothetical protein
MKGKGGQIHTVECDAASLFDAAEKELLGTLENIRGGTKPCHSR